MLLLYPLLALIVFVINVIPAFMPPTWTLLAFFAIQYKLSLLPIVLIGAVCATLGRVTLAHFSKRLIRPHMSKKSQKNMSHLGNYLNRHTKVQLPLLILYAFLPIPSNQVYITAGISKMSVKYIAICFFFGRIISYTFWVYSARHVANNINTIFGENLTKTNIIGIEIISFVIIYGITRINWQKVLPKK